MVDMAVPEMSEAELKAKLTDWLWRINNLYYITDKNGNKVLFQMNPAQSFFFQYMWFRNIILKARQLGFTTFMMIFMLDAALFVDNTKCAVIAHAKDDAKRLFREKIKFAYDNLPASIKAMMPAKNDSAGELVFANGSSITVGTSFRGGTLKYLHISEFGKICAKYPEKAREIVTGAFEAVGLNCVITIESTAEGKGGYFYEYSTEAENNQKSGRELTRLDWEFFFYPWYQDPNYSIESNLPIVERLQTYFVELESKLGITLTNGQKQWYAAKERVLGADMKREYPSTPAEAFEQAIKGAYYATQFDKIYRENRITRVPHETSAQVHTFWDLGVSDYMSIWFVQLVGREYRVINFYQNHSEGLKHYIDHLSELAIKHGYSYGIHVAPHDIAQRELTTGLSRQEQAANMGINFEIAPRLSVMDGIEAVRSVLGLCWFDETKTETGVAGLTNYRKAWDDKLGTWKGYPLHDEHSHPADAFRTFAVSVRLLQDLMSHSYASASYVQDDSTDQGWD
ncbi:terminase [Gayadomonas joobiniege]|uniref:terminase n=1 Tax=Gayadomonas joobiniege TaxID=1234606 RepID=UPI00036CC1B6|nr:terminase [Gayadomonas joobiniege]